MDGMNDIFLSGEQKNVFEGPSSSCRESFKVKSSHATSKSSNRKISMEPYTKLKLSVDINTRSEILDKRTFIRLSHIHHLSNQYEEREKKRSSHLNSCINDIDNPARQTSSSSLCHFIYSQMDKLSTDWFTIGVVHRISLKISHILPPQSTSFQCIKEKSSKSSKITPFFVLRLNDLDNETSVVLFIAHDEAEKVKESLCVGSVIAILNPIGLLPKSETFIRVRTIFPIAFHVNHIDSLLHLGESTELAFCNWKRGIYSKSKSIQRSIQPSSSFPANSPCQIPLNRSKGKFCQFHFMQSIRTQQSRRPELCYGSSGLFSSATPFNNQMNDLNTIFVLDGHWITSNGDYIPPPSTESPMGDPHKMDEKETIKKQNNMKKIYYGSYCEIRNPETDATFIVRPEILHPCSFPPSAVAKLGFDPGSERKRSYLRLMSNLPKPMLGKGFDHGNNEDIILDE